MGTSIRNVTQDVFKKMVCSTVVAVVDEVGRIQRRTGTSFFVRGLNVSNFYFENIFFSYHSMFRINIIFQYNVFIRSEALVKFLHYFSLIFQKSLLLIISRKYKYIHQGVIVSLIPWKMNILSSWIFSTGSMRPESASIRVSSCIYWFKGKTIFTKYIIWLANFNLI